MNVLRAVDRPATPWRNGNGSTSEILVRRSAEDAGFDWRLSIATVSSDTDFSAFPGVDRELMALSPAVLGLLDEGERVALARYDVHRFPGENAVASVGVIGETLDLNLMCDRGRRRGSLTSQLVSGPVVLSAGADEVALVLLDGSLECREGMEPWTTLATHDAVVLASGAELEFRGGAGRVAIARVSPLPPVIT
ncbi:HutD family protein [Mycetocola sp. 2940]|uniref:HutD/Ves family protein n=1 Tax=Mycetocola sp. 2940 TaxID=3156452 RepID=UPI003391E965